MSSLEELKSQFLVSQDLSETKMLQLLKLAIQHCAVDQKGHVDIKTPNLSTKDKLMLVLAARLIAHHLDSSISSELSVEDLAKNTHIAAEQVRARMSDLAKERQVEVISRGIYQAMLHRIEPFLKSLKIVQGQP